jgi:hypothetical protein
VQAITEDFTTSPSAPGKKPNIVDVPLRAGKTALDLAGYPLQGVATLGEEFVGRPYQSAAELMTGKRLPRAKAAMGDALTAFIGPKKLPQTPSEVAAAFAKSELGNFFQRALNPQKRAAARVLKAAPPEKALPVAKEVHAAGGKPTMMGVTPRAGARLTRNAKVTSDMAEERMADYAEARRPEIVQSASDRIARESPHRGSVADRIEALENEQRTLADRQYSQAYAQPVKLTRESFDALNNPTLKPAMEAAMAEATAREFKPGGKRQLQELQELQAFPAKLEKFRKDFETWQASHVEGQPGLGPLPRPEPPKLPQISGATIDRIRHFASRIGRTLERADPAKAGTASGLRDLSKMLDSTLDQVPGLKAARATYRQYAARQRLMEINPEKVFSDPKAFRSEVKEAMGGAPLTRAAKADLTHLIISHLSEKAGRGVGQLQGLTASFAEGSNFRSNLISLLGTENAEKVSRAMKVSRKELQNMNYVLGGSATADKGADMAKVAGDAVQVGGALASHNVPHLMHLGGQLIRRRLSGMSEQDAEEIMKIMTSSEAPEKVYADLQKMVATGQVPPNYPQRVKELITKGFQASAAMRLTNQRDHQPQ